MLLPPPRQDDRRKEQIDEAVKTFFRINGTLETVKEVAVASPYAAWERIKRLKEEFPMDPEVSTMESELTLEVPLFANMLKRAEVLEREKQLGSSLSWYLKARNTFPRSEIAKAGIDRIVDKLLPEDDDDFTIGPGPATGPNSTSTTTSSADDGLDL